MMLMSDALCYRGLRSALGTGWRSQRIVEARYPLPHVAEGAWVRSERAQQLTVRFADVLCGVNDVIQHYQHAHAGGYSAGTDLRSARATTKAGNNKLGLQPRINEQAVNAILCV